MTAIENSLAAYEADVDFPAVSGMERLQTLMTRSALHRVQGQLTTDQRTRLAGTELSRALNLDRAAPRRNRQIHFQRSLC